MYHIYLLPIYNFQISNTSINFDKQNDKVYTNKDIPVFFNVKKIEIQSMNNYFKDSTKSINGTYSVTSTHEINKEAIMNNLSEFFNQSMDDLNTPSTFFKVGIVNQNLIISTVQFGMFSRSPFFKASTEKQALAGKNTIMNATKDTK